jgi:ferredoxin
MKNIKIIILSLLLLLITLTVLISEEPKQHCGKHFNMPENATLNESICGIVQVVDNKLQLVQDSTKLAFNLIIPENMEKEIEKVEIGKRYIFSGKNSKTGFVVDKFIIMETEHNNSKTSVNSAKCIGCRLCVNQCPEGAISMVKGKAVIDQEKCIDCGICIDGNGHFKGCPVKAIEKK